MTLTYLIRRLLQAIPVFLGVTFIVFLLMYMTPGDPVDLMMGEGGVVSEDEIARLRHELGLDRPFHVQYGRFLAGVFRGDLGNSITYRRPVASLIWERLPATIELTLVAGFIALVVAIPAGIVSAVRRYSLLDAVGSVASLVGVSMPGFWLGLILIIFFSVTLKVLPVAGRITYGTGLEPHTGFLVLDALLQGNSQALIDVLKHLIMPAIAMSVVMMAMTMRLTRSSMLEVINQDYIKTARAKGLHNRVVILKHALRNALIPVVTTVALNLGSLLGGNMIIETVFGWPGLGRLVVESVYSRDYPMVQGCVLVYALIYVSLNLLADLSYAYLNPRIGLE